MNRRPRLRMERRSDMARESSRTTADRTLSGPRLAEVALERRVRDRAEALWRSDGGRRGQPDHYWFEAVREVLARDGARSVSRTAA